MNHKAPGRIGYFCRFDSAKARLLSGLELVRCKADGSAAQVFVKNGKQMLIPRNLKDVEVRMVILSSNSKSKSLKKFFHSLKKPPILIKGSFQGKNQL